MKYLHGGDIYRNPVQYDFSVNINPLGMPEGCQEAAKKGVDLAGQYPDWKGERLVTGLAEAEGVKSGQLVLGNGAAELLYALCFFLRPKKALIPAPSFQEYEAAVRVAGGSVEFFYLQEEEDFVLTEERAESLAEKIAGGSYDIVFLCQPNNPTGSVAAFETVRRLAESCRRAGSVLCVDECFLPFCREEAELSAKGLLEEYDNLFILRAFTKIYGMPGLRLGYGMSGKNSFLQGVRSCIQPWNTSLPAQMAGEQALRAAGYVEKTRLFMETERELLDRQLRELAEAGKLKKVYPSQGNFILFRAEKSLGQELLKKGILIRDCSNFEGLSEGYFRVAVRDRTANEALTEAISTVKSQNEEEEDSRSCMQEQGKKLKTKLQDVRGSKDKK